VTENRKRLRKDRKVATEDRNQNSQRESDGKISKHVYTSRVVTLCIDTLCTAMLILALIILTLKVLGYSFFTVETGSMADEYPIGTVIVVQPVAFEEVQVGDVVSYYMGDDTVVTHRVVGIDSEAQTLTTQGDENDSPDGLAVPYASVAGEPILSVRRLGYVYLYASTTEGKATLLAAVALGVVAASYPRHHRKG
jgi:signal peptidase